MSSPIVLKHLLTSAIILLSALHYSSAQQITFQKTYGGMGVDEGRCVHQTSDGGYIIAGYSNSFGAGNSSDFYLIKTNAIGDTLWTKDYGVTIDIWAYSVQQTTDGGYAILGHTLSYGASNDNICLIKTNANGNLFWIREFGGIDNDRGFSIQQTTDGGYIIVGSTSSFGAGGSDVYLVKTNSSGIAIWSKAYGGINDDVGYSVRQTTDGGYIISGYTFSFGSGQSYLIKTDSIGNSLWSKTFVNYWAGLSVEQTTDGGYIFTGITIGLGAGQGDVYLIKTDSIGNSVWAKTFGGANQDQGDFVQQTTDSGYIIVGGSYSFSSGIPKIYLIKTDANGDTLWTKTLGGNTSFYFCSIQQTTDGGYIIAGSITSPGVINQDIYLIKTDSLGNSGCNQSNPATIVTTPATIVTTPTTIVTSPATIVTTPATIVGSGGVVTTLCTSVGIKETTAENAISIFPNPAEKELIIKNEQLIIKSVEIENVFGENAYRSKFKIEYSTVKINVSNLSFGIYFVKVATDKGSVVKKFVKE